MGGAMPKPEAAGHESLAAVEKVFVYYTHTFKGKKYDVTGCYNKVMNAEGGPRVVYRKDIHENCEGNASANSEKKFTKRFEVKEAANDQSAWWIEIEESDGSWILAESKSKRTCYETDFRVAPNWHGYTCTTWIDPNTKTRDCLPVGQHPIIFGEGDFFLYYCTENSELRFCQVENVGADSAELEITCKILRRYTGKDKGQQFSETKDLGNFQFKPSPKNARTLKKLSPFVEEHNEEWKNFCEATYKERIKAVQAIKDANRMELKAGREPFSMDINVPKLVENGLSKWSKNEEEIRQWRIEHPDGVIRRTW